MSTPENEMAIYLQQHKVPVLIDEMVLSMERERPSDVMTFMQKWLQTKQKVDPSFGISTPMPLPKLTEDEKKALASGLGGVMGLLRRTGTVMETQKMRDRTRGIHTVTSEIRHAAEIDISATEDSMVGAKRMNGIICTIGPASDNVPMLVKLMKAGMNVARLNFSHGSYESHTRTVENVREAAKQAGKLIALALDTKGPEIRTGTRAGYVPGTAAVDIEYKAGTKVKVSSNPADMTKCDETLMGVDYVNLPRVVEIGGKIFVDDGLLQLEITDIGPDFVMTECINSAAIGNNKGVNLPDAKVDLPAISKRDAEDLKFARRMDMDMVFASFIRKPADIASVHEALGPGDKIMVIAKIENQEGCDNLLDILQVADGVMVARGDLGIEIAPEKVFIAQKFMISNCMLAGKPVICATQMLETMTKNPRPTRAEVSDVCNAVLEGADCTMLSGETAKGKYPVESVETMARCGLQAQCAMSGRRIFEQMRAALQPPIPFQEVIAQSAVNIAFETAAAGIVVLSNTGRTARLLAKYRPVCPIFAVTHVPKNARQLNLSRGVFSVLTAEPKDEFDFDARVQAGINYGRLSGDIVTGDQVVVVHSDGNRPELGANLVRVVQVR
jgi:pyruvate kinase